METNTVSDSVENDFYKVSAKELRKSARKSNMNSKCKKADLVKALISVPNDVTGIKDITTEVRMTRSRASVFRPLSYISDNVQDTDTRTNAKSNMNNSVKVDNELTLFDTKTKRKTRGKKKQKEEKTQSKVSYDTSEMFPIVNIIAANIPHRPVEICNKYVVDQTETKSPIKKDAITLKKSKRMKMESDIKSEPKELASAGDTVILSPSISYCNSLENEREALNCSHSVKSQTSEKAKEKTGKRGGKRKKEEDNVVNYKQIKKSVSEESEFMKDAKSLDRLQIEKNSTSGLELEKVDTSVVDSSSDQNNENNNQTNETIENVSIVTDKPAPKKLKRDIKPQKVAGQEINANKKVQLVETREMETCTNLEESRRGSPRVKKGEQLDSCKTGETNKNQVDTSLVQCNTKQNTENGNEDKENDKTAPKKLRKGKKSKNVRVQNVSVNEKVQLIETDISQEMYSTTLQSSSHRETRTSKSSDNSKRSSPQLKISEELVSHDDLMLTRLNSIGPAENESQPSESCKDNEPFSSGTMPALIRGSTFTLDNKDGKSPRRSSVRLTPTPSASKKGTPPTMAKTIGKSIGARIISSSMKQDIKPSQKNFTGSSVKKTIMKHTTTSGSAFKNKLGVARKLPDFRAAHQKLFSNMESICDNEKRKLERAQGLIQSPAAPRCAFTVMNKNREQLNNSLGTKTKIATPSKVQSPLRLLPPRSTTKVKTPVSACKPGPTSSTNRFGFRSAMKKKEANEIVGKKLPPVSLEKRKDQERNFIRGVRMNKRFMLQMQMRQNQL